MPKILLIEDNPAHAEIIQRMIGFYAPQLEVTHLPDGVEALAFLAGAGDRNNESLPDLILLDIKLPRLDGHGVLKALKQNRVTADIPVIMLTTSSTREDVVAALDRDVEDYLVKPFTEAHIRAIERALSVKL